MKSEFCVIYRFKITPEKEPQFRQGWVRVTHAIREQRGGLGSRLHRSEDGYFVAYAQWPDRAAWEDSRASKDADPEGMAMMAEAIEDRLPPILLEPQIDLLEPVDIGA